jgi:hypothetical protein
MADSIRNGVLRSCQTVMTSQKLEFEAAAEESDNSTWRISQEKTQLQRLDFFLLRSPPVRAGSVLILEAFSPK